MTKFVNATSSPSVCWNMETILVLLDSRMFVDVHPHSTLSLQRWAEPRRNDELDKTKIWDFSPLKGTVNQLRCNLAH